MCTHGAEGLGRARFLALGRAAWLQPGVVRANNAEGILHLLHGTHGLRLQPGWYSSLTVGTTWIGENHSRGGMQN